MHIQTTETVAEDTKITKIWGRVAVHDTTMRTQGPTAIDVVSLENTLTKATKKKFPVANAVIGVRTTPYGNTSTSCLMEGTAVTLEGPDFSGTGGS